MKRVRERTATTSCVSSGREEARAIVYGAIAQRRTRSFSDRSKISMK
jgi:exopolyphosphatase/pppGpp-phosphohydrolase